MFVSDRALCFFESDRFIDLVKLYKDVAYPIMVPQIDKIISDYW